MYPTFERVSPTESSVTWPSPWLGVWKAADAQVAVIGARIGVTPTERA